MFISMQITIWYTKIEYSKSTQVNEFVIFENINIVRLNT